MYQRADLLKQLEKLGVPRNTIVMAHTSLRAVGEVEGGGEAFLDTLISYVTKDRSPEGGLFCVPTHTWANLENDDPVKLDMTTDWTCVGTLPTLALRRPDAVRTIHPTHSIAVFGDPAKVKAYAEDEILTDSSTGAKGCWGKLFDMDGSILLIGVGHNRDTYIHAVEDILGIPNRLTENPKPLKVRLKSGEVIDRPIRCHNTEGFRDVSEKYPKYEPAFRAHGCIRDGFLGDAKVQLCSCRKMLEVVKLIRERSGGIELMADETPLPEEYYR